MVHMNTSHVLPLEGEQIVIRESIYTIGRFIAQGAFGLVYECADQWGNALVAKVLVPTPTQVDMVRAAWHREASNLVSLRHPAITYIYDVFEHKGAFYIIVERCFSDLNALFAAPNYDADSWLPFIARDVLQAVHYIHQAGYVHKDLHPGNIFITWKTDRISPTGRAAASFKIGDLGITREESDMNKHNTILAKWIFPPEALDGQFGPMGRSIDVYHIGLVLLSVLLRTTRVFTESEIVSGTPRQIAESLPSRYATSVARALRRHVSARPSIVELWHLILGVTPAETWTLQ